MATAAPTLEALIQKSTNPLNVDDDPNAIQAVCHAVSAEPGGVSTAIRLIAHKIQSPQERESLQALSVLQACVNNCGPLFHAEIGKFRFLNEMIKLVSPKYLGNHTHALVKTKVVELLYTWTIDLKDEPKILEAYNMLKKQGVIKDDPAYIGAPSQPEPRSRPNAVFEDEEKSLLLKRLLKSKNPEDLHKANALIKSMVKEDERRMERTSRRIVEVETALNNVRVLDEMLSRHQEAPAGQADLDLMSELHSSCTTLRSNLYRLVSDMDDKEEGIGDLLKANDELSRVMGRYKLIVEGTRVDTMNSSHPLDSKGPATSDQREQKDGEILLDLSTPEDAPQSSQGTTDLVNKDLEDIGIGGLSLGQAVTTPSVNALNAVQVQPTPPPITKKATEENSASLLDDLEGIFPVPAAASGIGLPLGSSLQSAMAPTLIPQTLSGTAASENQVEEKPEGLVDPLEDLAALGTSLIKQNLPANIPVQVQFKAQEKMTLNQMKEQHLTATALIPNKSIAPVPASTAPTLASSITPNIDSVKDSTGAASASPVTLDLLSGDVSLGLSSELKDSSLLGSSDESILDEKPASAPVINTKTEDAPRPKVSRNPQFMEVKPMTELKVCLENIKPGKQAPVTVLESNDITMNLHFTENQPRDDVAVVVVSTMSRCSMPLSNYVLQAVVPKGCKVRLQPPSSVELAAFSPFLPPPAITQIMLIANPNKLNVSLKMMLSYTMDDDPITEMGEIASLPL